MAIAKTKKMLVEVARQLFISKGVDDTTMNDIAVASGKGRRTLYTYFRNKEAIYLACVESETKIISEAFEEVEKANVGPEEKMIMLVRVHLDTYKDAVMRNGNLHGEFFKDILEIEKVRMHLDRKEIVMMMKILSDGVSKNIFYIDDIKRNAIVIQQSLKGMEVPYIREVMFERKNKDKKFLFDFLMYGLKGKKTK